MCRTRSSVRQRGLRGLLHAQPAVGPMLPPWLVSAVLLHVTWSHRARATCRAAARRRDRRCGPGGLMPAPAPPKRLAPARHPAHAAPYIRRSLEERAAAASADRPCPRAGATDGTSSRGGCCAGAIVTCGSLAHTRCVSDGSTWAGRTSGRRGARGARLCQKWFGFSLFYYLFDHTHTHCQRDVDVRRATFTHLKQRSRSRREGA